MPIRFLARGGAEDMEDVDQEDEESSTFDEDEDDDDVSITDKQTKKRKYFLKRRKIKFLNRIAEVTSFLLKREDDATLEREGSLSRKQRRQLYSTTALQYDDSEEDDNRVTQQSDLSRPGR